MNFKQMENDLEHITKLIQEYYPREKPIFKELYSMHKEINPRIEKDKLKKAFLISKKAHSGQFRYSGEPFFAHDCRTGYICDFLSQDNITTYTGQLHDSVEDSKNPDKHMLDIYKDFGLGVFLTVMGVTNLKKQTDQYARVESFRDKYVPNIETVKLGDVIDNLPSVEYLPGTNGKSAEQRQMDYLDVVCTKVLPMAMRFDKVNNTELEDYMRGLIKKNYKR